MEPFEIIHVDTQVVACDGDAGVDGHPKVYLNLSAAGKVECPYCSRLFVHDVQRGKLDVTQPTAAAAPPAATQKS